MYALSGPIDVTDFLTTLVGLRQSLVGITRRPRRAPSKNHALVFVDLGSEHSRRGRELELPFHIGSGRAGRRRTLATGEPLARRGISVSQLAEHALCMVRDVFRLTQTSTTRLPSTGSIA